MWNKKCPNYLTPSLGFIIGTQIVGVAFDYNLLACLKLYEKWVLQHLKAIYMGFWWMSISLGSVSGLQIPTAPCFIAQVQLQHVKNGTFDMTCMGCIPFSIHAKIHPPQS